MFLLLGSTKCKKCQIFLTSLKLTRDQCSISSVSLPNSKLKRRGRVDFELREKINSTLDNNSWILYMLERKALDFAYTHEKQVQRMKCFLIPFLNSMVEYLLANFSLARCSILSLHWPQNEFHSQICPLEVKTSQFTDFMQPFFWWCSVPKYFQPIFLVCQRECVTQERSASDVCKACRRI